MNVNGYEIDDKNIRVEVIDGETQRIINKKGMEQLIRQHGTPEGFEFLKAIKKHEHGDE